ncbi:hypothetical protein ACUXST_001588 [Sphingomonas sp. F9_3S_D5_B_2]
MASNAGEAQGRRFPWRIIGWGGAVALLALPFVAMQFHTDVNWTLGDFIVFGVMLGTVGAGVELAVRASGSWAYRGGAVLGLAATFLVVWANLAVGIVGNEHNPANQFFFLALLIGLVSAAAARFRAHGMALAMLVTAGGLMAAFAAAMIDRPEEPGVHVTVEFAGTSVFAMLFVGAAALFRKAARAPVSGDRPA